MTNHIKLKVLLLKTILIAIPLIILMTFLTIDIGEQDLFSFQVKERPEYPNEWMYNQRAYPNNYINKKAMQNAMAQTKAIKAQRRSQNAASEDWELIGPLNTGGRITDIAISPDSNDVFYACTAVGGVFRTQDRGQSWEAVFDEVGVPSIGNIAVAPSNGNRIYVGTGEANGSATSGAFFGNGMYRSDDAGDSWSAIGLEQSNHIGRIVVDPNDEDRVFAAATGILYDKNNERGIYRSATGGNEWEQVLFITDSTAAIDLVMNPVHTDTLFAAMWERTRKPWQRDYGGLTSGVHRSTDGGDTWELLGNGLPIADEQTGRIGLAISESNPNIVYARYTTNEITNTFNGVYRSEDSGETWELFALNDLNNIDSSFGWYFGNIRVHPENANEVFVLGQTLFFNDPTSPSDWDFDSGFQLHVDHHAMEFSKTDGDFILSGNDGGIYITEDRGETWTQFENLPITQMYNIEVDFLEPTTLFAGTQDNNTIRTSTAGMNDWIPVIGGDGFHVNIDPEDNSFVYGEFQFGNLRRSTDGGFSFVPALNGIDPNDRNNWNTPVILSPFDPSVVYYGSNRLYRSDDRAVNWSPISDDLTDGLHPSQSLSYGTLTAIAASHNNLDVVYTGSDDGNINVTFNNGETWTNISEGLLPDRYVTAIAIDPEDDLTVYVTLSGFTTLDYTPHVFKTEDGGASWNDLSSNLPSIPANEIIIAAINGENILFLGTDMNVWYSTDDGANWILSSDNLPPTIIRDLKYHQPTQTLYVGTFGRSMYSLDVSDFVLSADDSSSNESISFKAFPIPASGTITISHPLEGNGAIELYDLAGRKIQTLFSGALDTNTNATYNLPTVSPGIYILELYNGKNSLTQKIVIE